MKETMAVWNDGQIKTAKAWMARVQKWRFVYLDCESRSRRWNSYMQIIMFILMALSPTTSFATFFDGLTEGTRLTMVGALSSSVMLVRSIQNFWKLEEQAQMFKDTAHKFHEIQSRIKTQLTASRTNKMEWDTFKDKLMDSLMSIHSNAPTAPYEILAYHGIINSKEEAFSTSQHELLMNEASNHMETAAVTTSQLVSPVTQNQNNKKNAIKKALKGISSQTSLMAREANTRAVFDLAEDDGGVNHDESEGQRTMPTLPRFDLNNSVMA
jgi:hypothetical protein